MKHFEAQIIPKQTYTLKEIFYTDNIQEANGKSANAMPTSKNAKRRSIGASSSARSSLNGKNSNGITGSTSGKDRLKISQTRPIPRPCYIYQDALFSPAVKLRYISFRNYYCASLVILVKNETTGKFEVAMDKYQLMKDPHFEDDAQNKHIIDVKQQFNLSNFDVNSVRHLRFLYLQPSPNWRTVFLRDIEFYTFCDSKPLLQQVWRGLAENRTTMRAGRAGASGEKVVMDMLDKMFKKHKEGSVMENRDELVHKKLESMLDKVAQIKQVSKSFDHFREEKAEQTAEGITSRSKDVTPNETMMVFELSTQP